MRKTIHPLIIVLVGHPYSEIFKGGSELRLSLWRKPCGEVLCDRGHTVGLRVTLTVRMD